jgi:hypothetical protein
MNCRIEDSERGVPEPFPRTATRPEAVVVEVYTQPACQLFSPAALVANAFGAG